MFSISSHNNKLTIMMLKLVLLIVCLEAMAGEDAYCDKNDLRYLFAKVHNMEKQVNKLNTELEELNSKFDETSVKLNSGIGDISEQLKSLITSTALRGGWSDWSAWGSCSATCGTGLQSRTRTCSNPSPDLHGRPCVGDYSDYQHCAITSCYERNCKVLKDKGDTTTGFKTIVPDGINPVRVLCIMDIEGGGWTVFQQRESATDFYKNWQAYRNGFGDDTNFWLGLEYIHRLTAQGNYELRIDMMRTTNERAAAKYKIFSVGNETMLYKLSIGNYSFDPAFNDPGDSFGHNGMNFTTYDKDNDPWVLNCAVFYKGGYWYHGCHYNNLNGVYGSTTSAEGINWYSWTGNYESLKYTRMMIRPN